MNLVSQNQYLVCVMGCKCNELVSIWPILFQASRSEKYKAASNYYSTTYTVDELMQSKSMKKESCSKLKWDSGTRQYVDMLVDAIKKDQAQKAKKKGRAFTYS